MLACLPPTPPIQVVSEFGELMGSRMDDEIAESGTELDGRFSTVRTKESNLGDLVCDVFMSTVQADCVIINSGTLR